MAKISRKILAALLAAITVFSAFFAAAELGTVKANAAGWNGTNYGGGSVQGYRTFLQAFGIDYNTYMKWLDDHDDDSPNPDYYLGTPYVGYDHRNPHGDCKGALGAYDVPGKEGLNCTGFVWHVLYKAAQNSGASRAQINSLPVMGAVPSTWANLGVYRIYFRTKEEALASGVLEKGDLLWIYGTKDNHNAIFYGNNSSHDRFWHSAGKNNNLAKIKSAGTFLGMWVAKVTQPDNIELHVNPSLSGSKDDNSMFGAKYCVFKSKSDAQAAAKSSASGSEWDQRLGTIVLNKSGYGSFRTQGAPANSQLFVNGSAQTGLSYFGSAARKLSAKNTYYAAQYCPAPGMERDTAVYEFTDSGRRYSTGYKLYSFKTPRTVQNPAFSKIESSALGVKLSWNAVKGADKYRVYYKNRNGDWIKMTQTADTSYTDADVSYGTTYTYTIRCVDDDGDFISGYNKSGWKYAYTGTQTPVFSSLKSEAQGVRLKWDAVKGAAKYRLYYVSGSGSWKRMGDTASTEFLDKVVKYGATYTYTIRALNAKGNVISDYVRSGKSCKYSGTATPQIKSMQNTKSGVKMSWDKVNGAVKYRLFYLSKSGWKRLGDTSSTTFLDTDVRPGGTYTYTIRCVGAYDNYISAYNTSGSKITYVK